MVKSIADAFNEITVAQGGTVPTDRSVAGAIDALTDVLAGSNVNSPKTIAGAITMLGEHIGGDEQETVDVPFIGLTMDGVFRTDFPWEVRTLSGDSISLVEGEPIEDGGRTAHPWVAESVPVGDVLVVDVDFDSARWGLSRASSLYTSVAPIIRDADLDVALPAVVACKTEQDGSCPPLLVLGIAPNIFARFTNYTETGGTMANLEYKIASASSWTTAYREEGHDTSITEIEVGVTVTIKSNATIDHIYVSQGGADPVEVAEGMDIGYRFTVTELPVVIIQDGGTFGE